MDRSTVFCALALAGAGAAGCGGDDITYGPGTDAGSDAQHDATAMDVAPVDGAPDASREAGDAGGDASDAAAYPARLLLSYNNMATSELVAVGVADKMVDGRLTYPGFIGTVQAGTDLFLLEQANDVVAHLEPQAPWMIDSSWSVALSDAVDGGSGYSDPDAVVVSGPGMGKAYVLRYTRNEIAIIDATQHADGGVPTGTIDLSSLVQAADSDGVVEMTGGVYVPASQRVYVVLGNIDRNLVAPDGFTLLCAATTASVIAIDVTNDQVDRSLGGSAPGGGYPLGGYDPVLGLVSFDAANNRLLIVHSGCNQAPATPDAGPGPILKREVESISVTSGAATQLLDATSQGFPSQFAYIDGTHAVLGFDFTGAEVHSWDPTSTTLGAVIPNAPDYFAYDGLGNLLGTRADMTADGGMNVDVVSVKISDGTSTTFLSNPFSVPGGFVGGVAVWPAP